MSPHRFLYRQMKDHNNVKGRVHRDIKLFRCVHSPAEKDFQWRFKNVVDRMKKDFPEYLQELYEKTGRAEKGVPFDDHVEFVAQDVLRELQLEELDSLEEQIKTLRERCYDILPGSDDMIASIRDLYQAHDYI